MFSRKIAFFLLLVVVTVFATGCIRSIVPNAVHLNTPEAIRLDSPEWSPDGSMFAYKTWEGTLGIGNVYVYFLESGENKVIRDSGLSHEVKWSPDGSVLLISEARTFDLVNIDSLQIISTFDGFAGGWTPDGAFYTLSRRPQDDKIELFAGELFSNELKSIAVIKDSETFGSYSYSSIDNDYLVMSFGTGDVVPGTHDANDIFVFDLAGNQLFRLGSTQSDDIDPSLYPLISGWLIYAESKENGAIVFTNFTGTCMHRANVTEELITGVSISPDGERLALSVNSQLFVIQFDDAFGHPANYLINMCQSESPN